MVLGALVVFFWTVFGFWGVFLGFLGGAGVPFVFSLNGFWLRAFRAAFVFFGSAVVFFDFCWRPFFGGGIFFWIVFLFLTFCQLLSFNEFSVGSVRSFEF